jgi:pyrroline-5-carboxylate reductase
LAASLVLAGCGKMGGALLDGWLSRGMSADDVAVVEPGVESREAAARRLGHGVHAGPEELPADVKPGVVVFAVKPQVMDQVAPAYRRFVAPDAVFLSIAAGKTIAYFTERLGGEAAIVRAMPNTPAAVGRGITVACPNARAGAAHVRRCQELLEAVGEVLWTDDESQLDAVTAVSGSGPAYVFLLAECLAEAGAAAGLPVEMARRLARATVAGAGELLHRAPEEPEVLRRNVTSPGGTTAAALSILMAPDGLRPLLAKAVQAAARRSRELAG